MVSTQPPRVSVEPLRLVLTMGEVVAGPGTGEIAGVTRPDLDRLTSFEQILERDGTPSHRFMAIWQETMERIEEAFDGLTGQVVNLETLVAQIQAAQDLARAANDTATTVADQASLAASYTNPIGVLTASNDGTITVAAHTRVYGTNGSVSVSGGSLSGFAQGSYVTVYYVDAGREGGAVAYQGTTSAVAQEGNTHIVGQVTIPAAGQPPAEGAGPTAPGFKLPDDGFTGGDYIIQ